MEHYEPEATRADDWEVAEAVEVDLSRPPSTVDQSDWQPWGGFHALTAGNINLSGPLEIVGETDWPPLPSLNALAASKTVERKPEKSGERIVAKAWVTKLRSGWKEQEVSSGLCSLSFASMVSDGYYRSDSPVYADPPMQLLYTDDLDRPTLVVPSAQKWYVPLPADSYAGTDISQLLQVPYTFVDTEALVKEMLDALPIYHSDTPLLSVDVEGLDLGKSHGETYLIQISDSHSHHLYTIDILTLGHQAFQTTATAGKWTLRKLLQSVWVLKLFCDIRSDSRALFTQFGIHLRGIKDIQNMELASRQEPHKRHWRNGLVRLIDSYGGLTWEEKRRFRTYKTSGQAVCKSWGYSQFGVRPLRADLALYAVNDVFYLHRVYEKLTWFLSKVSPERVESADLATQENILRTHRPDYDVDPGQGRPMQAASWPWEYDDDYHPASDSA
jgi:exonuclease 3'-5' domain-containing protein 1